MAKSSPIEIRPAAGGRLMAGLSAESAGIANYVVKRDWRRHLDRELRAEGHEGLALDQSFDTTIQVTPSGSASALSLIAQARRGDGKRIIVAGNKTTLWAYTGLEDTRYFESGYVEDGYVDETQYGWIKIADGLSAAGNRWEAEQVGDFIVLNNGVDLPLTFRPGDTEALPIYELREQQIASVGTIANHNGNLLCCDLWVINDVDFADLMAPTVVNGDGTFTPNPDQYAAFTDTTKMQRFQWRVLPSMNGLPRRFGSIVPVSASLNDYELKFKYPVRSLPELVAYNSAWNYANLGTLGGMTDITVLYAGISGSTLSTGLVSIAPDIAMSCRISKPVLSPIVDSGDLESSLEAADAASGYAGTFVDLIGDGGAIVKVKQLREAVVVYKDTAFVYIGTFTGDITTPYNFQKIEIANEGQAIHYRNTLISAGGGFYGSCHIYAGRNAFYKFDLFTQTPTELPEFQSSQEVFFNSAPDTENAFAAENPLTREWFFVSGSQGDDRALCFDYAYKTTRTTSAPINAAAKVQHPTRPGWLFLFSDDSGGVQRYGMWDDPVERPTVTLTISSNQATASSDFFTTDHVGKTLLLSSGDMVAVSKCISGTVVQFTGTASNTSGPVTFCVIPATWHRNGAVYDSTLESGIGDMGMADAEKMVTRYAPIAASKLAWDTVAFPQFPTDLEVFFKSAMNPTGDPEFVQSATVQQPNNLVEPTFIGYYIGNKIVISGINNPFALANQIWGIQSIGSQSAGRV